MDLAVMAMDTVLDGRVGAPPAATVARGEMRDWGGWYYVDHGGDVCTTAGIILPAAFHLPKVALGAVGIHRQFNT